MATNRRAKEWNGTEFALVIGGVTLLFGVWAFAGCVGCKPVARPAPAVSPAPQIRTPNPLTIEERFPVSRAVWLRQRDNAIAAIAQLDTVAAKSKQAEEIAAAEKQLAATQKRLAALKKDTFAGDRDRSKGSD